MTARAVQEDLKPAIVPPPGRILVRELKARGWTQKQLSEVLGRPAQVVNEIVKGKKGVTPETSAELSAAFGTPPDFWYRLQAEYDFWRADRPEVKRRTKAIAARAAKTKSAHA